MAEEMFKTPLFEEHVALGARMVPFSGWQMPVQYKEGILAEHHHTREFVSLFDICHMGEFRVRGENAARELDHALARSVADQKTGTCRYNFLLNDQGCVLDDLIVYRIDEDEFFIVVNAGTMENDAKVLRERLSSDIEFQNESAQTAKLDLQGPLSADILQALGLEKDILPGYYKWIDAEVGGTSCLLSRTGYTGELGYELYFDAEHAVDLWRLLLARDDVKPAGLGARDTLRLEMGYALYGHELNDTLTPVDAGYAGMLKLENPREFIGAKALRKAKSKKRLVGIVMEGRRAAREGAQILYGADVIGTVTSGAFGPSIEKAVALAYVKSCVDIPDDATLTLKVGASEIEGRLGELPFYKDGTVRVKL